MSDVDILSLFENDSYDIAIISTYNFDPVFFERRLLRSKGLAKSRRIIIFMDNSQYQQLLSCNLSLNWINRRYLMVPMALPKGVYHSKLSLFLNQEGGQVLCGSSNLTQAGYTHNLELVNKVPIVINEEKKIYQNIAILKDTLHFYGQILSYTTNEYKDIAKKWIGELSAYIPWIEKINQNQGQSDQLKLVTNISKDIYSSIVSELKGKYISKIMIVSPFFDKKLEMLSWIIKQWPKAKVELISQQNTGNLNAKFIPKISKNIKLYELSIPENRRLHAKLLSFQYEQNCLIVTGSANLSISALQKGNVESCLFYTRRQDEVQDLLNGDIERIQISPHDFQSGNEEMPAPIYKNNEIIQLHSCLQKVENIIDLVYSVSTEDKLEHLSCEIINAGELKPLCSIPMSLVNNLKKKDVALKIDTNITSQFQGTVQCRLKAIVNGKRILSVPGWLVQELRLTYTPCDYDSTFESERIIRETGMGLIEALDIRAQEQGVSSVIEYLNNLNIRFCGEKELNRTIQNKLKYRDPHQSNQDIDWSSFFQNKVENLKEAVCDWVDRHQKKILHKHAGSGNLNGLTNFIDVFVTCNRLLYVYGKRGVIPKPWVVGKITENISIFTSGKETRNEAYWGYIDSIYNTYSGDHEMVNKELAEMKVFEHLFASLFIAQMVRKDYFESPNVDPFILLPSEQKMISEMLKLSNLSMPYTQDIITLLQNYHYLEKDEQEWINYLALQIKYKICLK